jgi:hypothetical protein
MMNITTNSDRPVNQHFVGGMLCPFSVKNKPTEESVIKEEAEILSYIPSFAIQDIEDFYSVNTKNINKVNSNILYSSNLSMECKQLCSGCMTNQKISKKNDNNSKPNNDTFKNPVEKFINEISDAFI